MGAGEAVWLCLCPRDLCVVRSDELISADSEVAHAVRYLARGDVAFNTNGEYMDLREGNRIDNAVMCC